MQLTLRGIRVLVTRPEGQSTDFIRFLEERGARVTSLPLIQIGPPPSERELLDAVNRADAFSWLIFTSAVGVEAFAKRRKQDLPSALRIGAIGPATRMRWRSG